MRSARRISSSRRSTSPSKRDPELWAERLSGRDAADGKRPASCPRGASRQLSGFDDGAWWVQDVAASLPARLMGDVAGKRVADLCAAPGGKTAQLALAGAYGHGRRQLEDAARPACGRISTRLGLAAELVIGRRRDLAIPDEKFDAVLLDAPCSSTGTIRRHPDIPYIKSAKDIAALAVLQARLLDNAASLLKPGGRLVYSTCSLEPEEGEAQIAALLVRNDALRLIRGRQGRACRTGRVDRALGLPSHLPLRSQVR